MIGRRGFLTGLSSLIAAPAIVRADSLMKVRGLSMLEIVQEAPGKIMPIPCPPELDMFKLMFEGMRQMEENTRKLFAFQPVAIRTTFEHGQFVQRQISVKDFYAAK